MNLNNILEDKVNNYTMLKERLKEKILEVTFKKKDGTTRVMSCTLREDVLPKVEFAKTSDSKEPNYDVMSVWDTDKSAWRSFRLDSVETILDAQ